MKSESDNSTGSLRVWYLHQVGSDDVFRKQVKTPDEGVLLLTAIYELMLHLEDTDYIPDFCNVGGLEVWESNGDGGYEWCEWVSEDGCDISELIAEKDD